MSIIRVEKERGYFVASNTPFNDNRLSWEARGMMGFFLSKPDHWNANVGALINETAAGEHVVQRILKELETHGYLKRERTRKEDGTWEWVSTIYETPAIPQKSPNGTIGQLSTDGKPPYIVNTESVNTNTPQACACGHTLENPPSFDGDSWRKGMSLPELKIFRSVTDHWPGKAQAPIIWRTIHEHQFTKVFLIPFWEAWNARGFNPRNLAWLTEWATSGVIPTHGKKNQSTFERNKQALQQRIKNG